MEEMHKEKLTRLKAKEEECMNRLREKERNIESMAFEQRQTLLRELESLRSKDEQLKKAKTHEESINALAKEKNKEMESRLRSKEDDILRKETLMESNIQRKIDTFIND